MTVSQWGVDDTSPAPLRRKPQPPHYAVLVRGLLVYLEESSVSRPTIRYQSSSPHGTASSTIATTAYSSAATATSSPSAFVTAFDVSATALAASASASSAAALAL